MYGLCSSADSRIVLEGPFCHLNAFLNDGSLKHERACWWKGRGSKRKETMVRFIYTIQHTDHTSLIDMLREIQNLPLDCVSFLLYCMVSVWFFSYCRLSSWLCLWLLLDLVSSMGRGLGLRLSLVLGGSLLSGRVASCWSRIASDFLDLRFRCCFLVGIVTS